VADPRTFSSPSAIRWDVRCAIWLFTLVAACGFEVRVPIRGDGPQHDLGPVPDSDGIAPFVRAIDVVDGGVIGGPHAGFPLLVALSEPWLRDTSAGGAVAHPMGFDLHFSNDAAGLDPLEHEIEVYRGATGDLVAWVRLPMLSSTTVLYLHYGDPAITTSQENIAAVWAGEFAAVWHLGDGADAAGHTSGASVVGAVAAPGKVGDALRFGASDYLDAGSSTAIDDVFAGGGTAEGWFYATGWGEAAYGRLFDKGHSAGWSLGVNNVGPLASIYFLHGAGIQGRWDTAASSIALDRWTHVAVVYNQDTSTSDATWYVDGVAIGTTRSQTPSGLVTSDAAAPLYLGNRPSLDRAFDGLLDELRLSTTPRSAGWIDTTVRNQRDPSAFYVLGPEQ